jgi:hypothetical protein
MFISQLPIPQIDEQECSKFRLLVERIISNKEKGLSVNDDEKSIDTMAYALFELNSEEIDFVEHFGYMSS